MPKQEKQRLLVRKADAADLMSISIDSFERMVMPEIRSVRIGRRVLFTVADLQAWIDQRAALPLKRELPHHARRSARTRVLQGRSLPR